MAISSGSYLMDLFGIATAFVAIVYAYLKWSHQYWKRRGAPYLEPNVPFGNFLNPYNRKINEGDQVREMYNKAKAKGWKYCGIYNIGTPNLIIVDLELLKHVLTKDFLSFSDRGMYVNEKDDPLSGHLFSIGGTKWRNLRTKLSPTFTSGKMKAMFQTLVDSGVILENFFKENITSEDAVDIKDVLGRFSTDIIGSCAFGIECNSFKEPNSPFRLYGKKVFIQTKFELLKALFCHNFPDISRALGLAAVQKDVSKFYYKIVEDVVAYRERNNVIRNDFLQLLIDMKNKENGAEEQKLTMDEIAAQSFIFFLAGFETSSTTMTFALFELATHPQIQDRVRDEIKTVLEKHDNQMNYDSLTELKYMKQVIDETLRKYPPLPFVTRECVKDYKVPGEDLIIEKGISVIIPLNGIHYDEEYYKNPEDFDPDRFTEEKKKARHTYAHIPFGEGPRICIGERFGIMQTKVGLTSILKNFKVKLHEKTNMPIKMAVNTFIPTAEGEMWLSFDRI